MNYEHMIQLSMLLGPHVKSGSEVQVWNILRDFDLATADAETTAIPAPLVSDTEPWPRQPSSEPTPASPSNTPTATTLPQAGSSAGHGAATVVASDNPVKDMPGTARARANLRLGRTKDGKGRP